MRELNPEKVKSQSTYKTDGKFYALCVNESKRLLYAGSSDYSVHVLDSSGDQKEVLDRWKKHENYVTALTYVSSEGKQHVVSGSYDHQLIWWDADTGAAQHCIEAHLGWVRDLTYIPASHQIVSSGDDMVVRLWDASTGQPIRDMKGHETRTPQNHVTALYVVAVSTDGQFIASGDRIGEVRIWETATGNLVQQFQVPVLYTYDPRQRKRSIGGIRSLAFSPDNRQIAVGGIGQVQNVDGLAGAATVEVWDWNEPKQLFVAEAEGHKGIVNHLHFHTQSGWLIGAGGGSDGSFIAFWKPSDPEEMSECEDSEKTPAIQTYRVKSEGHIHRFCINSAGDRLFAAGHGKMEIWSLPVE